jgi:putative NADH-flavin reductase
MKITVFGGTGPTGEQIIRQALAAGHDVTAVARRPTALTINDPHLTVVAGDVLAPASMRPGVDSADAVLSTLGSRPLSQPTTVYSAGTATILDAMSDAGVHRFVGVTAAPIGPEEHKSLLDRHVVHPLLHRFFGEGYADMRLMEDQLVGSAIEWTVFRPPRLTNGKHTNRYRSAIDTRLPRVWTLARADLAAAMLAAVDDPTLVRRAVTIAA